MGIPHPTAAKIAVSTSAPAPADRDRVTWFRRLVALATLVTAAAMGCMVALCYDTHTWLDAVLYPSLAAAGIALSLLADHQLRRCLFCRRR